VAPRRADRGARFAIRPAALTSSASSKFKYTDQDSMLVAAAVAGGYIYLDYAEHFESTDDAEGTWLILLLWKEPRSDAGMPE
jgi:hypothetical protein